MLQPNQFEVNEAWIAFKLNEQPIHTEQDGDFDVFALMDVASCFILNYSMMSVASEELSQRESRRLLEQGRAHKEQWPKTLFIPSEQPATLLAAEAEGLGIGVVRVGVEELLPFIGEARQGFRERFG